MPRSRSRHRHHHHHHSRSGVSSSQKTNAPVFMTILFVAFAAIIAWIAGNGDSMILVAGMLFGGAIGWYVGNWMKRSARGK